MAVTRNGQVVRMTADNDAYVSSLKGLRIKGVRLVAAAATSTAQIREGTATSDPIMYSLACVANTTDESQLEVEFDSGNIFLDLSGAGAEVFIYLD